LLIVEGARDLLPPDQPDALYSMGQSQTVYYYVFTILMLLLVGLLSGYLADRLARAGGEVAAAKERAKRAERMAVLGRLAAGLAHEIRNPLSAISGAVQMLKTSVKLEEDRELCDIVMRESTRLDDLVSDMLQLSKVPEKKLAPLDLSSLVRDVVELARRSGRGAAEVALRYERPASVWVQADGSQIKQMAWNLIRNAVQASAPGGEVRITIQTEETVRLIVEDDGVGIDPDAQSHLFEEFFTTRSHGTGLGLAVVKRIADEHGIALKVKSERHKGATFVADFGPPIEHPRAEL
jgi:two-component system sensor histidine kinase HydH